MSSTLSHPIRGRWWIAASLFCLTLAASGPVQADGMDTTDTTTGTFGALATEILDSFHERYEAIDRSSPEGQDEYRHFLAELDAALVDALPRALVTRSAANCATSCSLARIGRSRASDAWSRSISNLSACPYDPNNAGNWPNYIDSAQVKSGTAALSGLGAESAACAASPDRYVVAPQLDVASQNSLQAWTENYYAWKRLGCSGAKQAATWASDAYLNFHNAEYYMWSCS